MLVASVISAVWSVALEPEAFMTPGPPSSHIAPSPDTVEAGLFARFQAGDPDAAGAIADQFQPRLIAYIRAIVHDVELAEELSQEVLITAIRKRTQVYGAEKLRPWLFAIARTTALKEAARKRYRAESPVEDEVLRRISPGEDPTQQDRMLAEKLHQTLMSVIQSLPDTERDLVQLRYFGGLQHRELSEALGMPMGSVGVKLGRALQKLRHTLEELGYRLGDFL